MYGIFLVGVCEVEISIVPKDVFDWIIKGTPTELVAVINALNTRYKGQELIDLLQGVRGCTPGVGSSPDNDRALYGSCLSRRSFSSIESYGRWQSRNPALVDTFEGCIY